MNNESDSEEEILVYAEFEDNVNIAKYRNIHVLGVNERNPIIQMDDTFFTGKFENPLGTYMFFEEDPTPQCLDPLFDRLPEKNLKYVYKTKKYIKMEHAYITPKEGTEVALQNQLIQPEEDIKPENFKTIQEALEKFKNEWDPSQTHELDRNSIVDTVRELNTSNIVDLEMDLNTNNIVNMEMDLNTNNIDKEVALQNQLQQSKEDAASELKVTHEAQDEKV